MTMFPTREKIRICFGHQAYRMLERFERRSTGLDAFQAWSREELAARAAEFDVLVVSGLWNNALISGAPRLRFVQSVSAGTNQYDTDAMRQAGIRLASAGGVNARAVSEHAMGLILAMVRRLPEARDNQAKHVWRGMIGELAGREDELEGKTLLVVGLGRIGGRLAHLARAFDMHVIGVRQNVAAGAGAAHEVVPFEALASVIPRADFVALTCPLTPQTERMIDAAALALMKPSCILVNVARGRCVDEPALIAALSARTIAGAALDCTVEEPLPDASPLWDMPHVLISPHTAGETRRYEDGVIDFLLENLARLWRGETALLNEVV